MSVRIDVWSWQYFVFWFGGALIVAATFQIFLHLRDAYDFQANPSSPDFLVRLGQALFLASVFVIVTNHPFHYDLDGTGTARAAITALAVAFQV